MDMQDEWYVIFARYLLYFIFPLFIGFIFLGGLPEVNILFGFAFFASMILFVGGVVFLMRRGFLLPLGYMSHKIERESGVIWSSFQAGRHEEKIEIGRPLKVVLSELQGKMTFYRIHVVGESGSLMVMWFKVEYYPIEKLISDIKLQWCQPLADWLGVDVEVKCLGN